MKIIRVPSAHAGLFLGMQLLADDHMVRDSRAGQVLVSTEPVTTVYLHPKNRVVFQPERDANPFFHFMEGLWMLAGRNDTTWIGDYNSSLAQFSDDGVTFHGAYGYRWRNWFVEPLPGSVGLDGAPDDWQPFDQLVQVANMLKGNKDERRAVLAMWDAENDLGRQGKDVPCNTHIYFSVVNGSLDMMVCNRSNDIIWGCYGANVVHMSMLHEVMAAWIGVPVGLYRQMSNNYHAYLEVFEKTKPILERGYYDPYVNEPLSPFSMVNTDIETWFQDLAMFMNEGPIIGFKDPFFRRVVTPMALSWAAFKNKGDEDRFDKALEITEQIIAHDWRLACTEWLTRRRLKQHV